MADGVYQHDIVRAYVTARCPDLRERHRNFLRALLATRPANGWPEREGAAQKTAEWYIATYAATHVRGAQMTCGAEEEDDELVGALVASDPCLQQACAEGLGEAEMRQRADPLIRL